MDVARLIGQLLRMVLRKGMSSGARRVAAPQQKPWKDMTPAERQQAKAARATMKRAKQALRVTRRFGKF